MLFIVLLFTAFALLLIGYALTVWVKALPFSLPSLKSVSTMMQGFPSLRLLKSKERILLNAKKLEEAGAKASDITPLLRESFLLLKPSVVPNSFLTTLEEHNEQVLEQIIQLSDREGTILTNLPDVSEDLAKHVEYLREYSMASHSRVEIEAKRKEKGKDLPEWVISEFTKKQEILAERIRSHSKELAYLIDALCSTFSSRASGKTNHIH